MKQQFFLILTLIGMSEYTFAEWKKIMTTYQSTSYTDPNSLQKRGDITSMNILIDYKTPPFDGNNLSYRSLALNAEYNCATKQFRTLKLTSYLGNMATGSKPYQSDEPSEWQAVPANSIQTELWKTACQKQKR